MEICFPFLTFLVPIVLNPILKKTHIRYTLVFHHMPKYSIFITGLRSAGPRKPGPWSPNKKSILAEESGLKWFLTEESRNRL